MPPATDPRPSASLSARRRVPVVLLTLLTLPAGCRVQPHTTAEQQSSYDAQARRPIPIRLPTHAADPSTPSATMSPASFIALHTAVVLNATGIDSATLQQAVRLSAPGGDPTKTHLHYTLAVPAGVTLAQGGAAAVAPDGYFLTADHAVERPATVVITPGLNRRGQLSLTARIPRLVARFPRVDLAVLHLDQPTPHHLEPRLPPLEPGEILYAASWINAPAAGPFLQLAHHHELDAPNLPALRALTFRARIPIRPGDSGFPFIDEAGRLCGIATASRLNRFGFPTKPTTVAAMLTAADLHRLLEADRARHPPSPVP